MAARWPGLPAGGLSATAAAGRALLAALGLLALLASAGRPAGAQTGGRPLPAADDLSRVRDRLQATAPVGAHREPDARTVAWSTLRRLALLGGEFVPPYRPVSAGEITGLLTRACTRGGPGLIPAAERRQLAWLLSRHGLAGGAWRHATGSGRTPRIHLLGGLRLGLHELGPGDLVAGEADLGGRGLRARLEPGLDAWRGSLWLGLTPRLQGPLHTTGRPDHPALRYRGWPVPTGRPAAGAARADAAWRLEVPRAVAGARLGRWALSAGWMPAAVGPGLDGGGLTLGPTGASVPQLVLRRTAPLRWSGFLRPLAPRHLLLRAGVTGEQTVRWQGQAGRQERRAHPVLMQWLVTWNHTAWWRTTLTHAVMAAARGGGTLWPDLLQANFPLLDATWNETEYGPITDRIVALSMEARWREAPWPLLPAAAGRIYWEYGGEDFRPHDLLPVIPEISAPASLAGAELIGHRWDLAAEFLDTRHPLVLWYGNAGFARGFSHRGTLLGDRRGGAVRSWTALVRWRPRSGASEWELRGRTSAWEQAADLPADVRRDAVVLSWRRLAGRGAWRLAAGWVREEVADHTDHWLQAHLERRF